MPLLRIDLQEGFADDAVSCRVNGRTVYDRPHVTTRPQIGRADSFEIEAVPGTAEVRIDAPRRGATLTLCIDADRTPYLGISLSRDGQHLEHRKSQEPFGYL